MNIRRAYRAWWQTLADPASTWRNLRSLEEIAAEYMILLLIAGLAAGVFVALSNGTTMVISWLFLDVQINIGRFLNYALGGIVAACFLALFIGTVGVFLASILVQPFARLAYAQTVRVLMVSMAPYLLFGWFVPLTPALIVWAGVLALTGIRFARTKRTVAKGTIRERE